MKIDAAQWHDIIAGESLLKDVPSTQTTVAFLSGDGQMKFVSTQLSF